MKARRMFQTLALVIVLALFLGSTGTVLAWSGSCSGYVTVQWGDTLSSLAAACGTSVGAIQAANPGLGWWLYAGQVIYMPTGYSNTSYQPGTSGNTYSTYVVQWGDTLGGIAMAYGVSLNDVLAVNPQIWNASLIFPGQVINLPSNAHYLPNYNTATPYPYPSPNSYPTPRPTATGFGNLKVTNGKGLLVRTGPGMNFSEIVSPFVSAVKNSTWQYKKDSLTTDAMQFVWVQVNLNPSSGFSTGWILTRDSLGNYFTSPTLGAPLDPNDP